MRVRLRNPDHEIDVPGERRVTDVLSDLWSNPETVLVIRGRELLTRRDRVSESDRLEIRPVISGGSP